MDTKRTKLKTEDIEYIQNSEEKVSVLCKKFKVTAPSIYAIKKGNYRARNMTKYYDTKEQIKKDAANEYFKLIGKLPEKYSVTYLAGCVQFFFAPGNYFFQLPNYTINNKDRFLQMVNSNLKYQIEEKTKNHLK